MKTPLLFTTFIAAGLTLHAAAEPSSDYVAHEWGTFTTIAGSDGQLLEWNPFIAEDLPDFVYERGRALVDRGDLSVFLIAKKIDQWLVRMETPVIYFHTDNPLELRARVDFPDGLITEWYPRAIDFGPSGTPKQAASTTRSFLDWGTFAVLPEIEALTNPLPGDGGSDNHYFAARAANAARVQFGSPLDCVRPMETEKFLFYRGVGDFQTPLHLQVVSDSDGRQKLSLSNNGPETLSGLHIVQIKDGQGAIRRIDSLAPGKSILRPLPSDPQPLSRVIEELSASMQQSLVAAGLYDSEAAAMIATWRDAWFEEEGLRVLHLLPTEWTDRTLPLQLDPAPRDIVRVMVGRAEIFTPDTEQKLESLFAGRERSDSDNVADAIQDLGLGRFVEPAFTRLANLESDRIRNQVSKFSNDVRSSMYKELREVRAAEQDQPKASTVNTAGL